MARIIEPIQYDHHCEMTAWGRPCRIVAANQTPNSIDLMAYKTGSMVRIDLSAFTSDQWDAYAQAALDMDNKNKRLK